MSNVFDLDTYTTSFDLYYPFNSDQNSFKFLRKAKSFTLSSTQKVSHFFSKPETKISALVSYWAVEATITAFGVYAFIKLGMFTPVFISLLLLAYITYATFGVIGEVTK
jgi:hypothetical protein